MVYGARKGPYRFILKRLESLDDVDLAAAVLESDCFRDLLEQTPLPVETFKRIVLLAPHQDDEIIGAGGTLLRASRSGADIHTVYVTDGALRPLPHTPFKSIEESVQVRNKEAAEVCRRLKANVHHLGISNVRLEPTRSHLQQLNELLRSIQPQVILTPWLLDWPAKHRFVNHLLWLMNRKHGMHDCEIWGYQVHTGILPNGYVDITEVADSKRSLLELFCSQNECYARYDHIAMGLAAWNARLVPSLKARFLELFAALPSTEYLGLIEKFYFGNLQRTYRGNAEVLPGVTKLHLEVCRQAKACKPNV